MRGLFVLLLLDLLPPAEQQEQDHEHDDADDQHHPVVRRHLHDALAGIGEHVGVELVKTDVVIDEVVCVMVDVGLEDLARLGVHHGFGVVADPIPVSEVVIAVGDDQHMAFVGEQLAVQLFAVGVQHVVVGVDISVDVRGEIHVRLHAGLVVKRLEPLFQGGGASDHACGVFEIRGLRDVLAVEPGALDRGFRNAARAAAGHQRKHGKEDQQDQKRRQASGAGGLALTVVGLLRLLILLLLRRLLEGGLLVIGAGLGVRRGVAVPIALTVRAVLIGHHASEQHALPKAASAEAAGITAGESAGGAVAGGG